MQGKCREKNLPLYMALFDLTKAFDTINQEVLWSILLQFGCTMRFFTIICLFHDDIEFMVMANGSNTEPFPARTVVKQGCIIDPTLFSIYLTAKLHLTIDKLPAGVKLTYRTTQPSALRKRVFEDNNIRSDTKFTVYRTVMVPASSEIWAVYSRHPKALEQYHQRCLHKILRIHSEERRINTSVLDQANITSIEALTTGCDELGI
eukprot:g41263.t1